VPDKRPRAVAHLGSRQIKRDCPQPRASFSLARCVQRTRLSRLRPLVAGRHVPSLRSHPYSEIFRGSKRLSRCRRGAPMRGRLPNRPGAESFGFQCGGFAYVATGRPAEIFSTNGKCRSDSESAARVLSFARSHCSTASVETIRKALLRDGAVKRSEKRGAWCIEGRHEVPTWRGRSRLAAASRQHRPGQDQGRTS